MITITVPEMKCARCSQSAPIQPRLLYLQSQVTPELREVFTVVLKERPETSVTDSDGRPWKVVADTKPLGWVKGPNDKDLCAACGVLWAEASKAFMVPPPEPVVEEKEVSEPAAVELAVTPAVTKPHSIFTSPPPVGPPNYGSTVGTPQSPFKR